ncbi:peptidylprolyl isomerase [Nocardioides currus]|uniref:Peptidylprolyl isomerase n=1 Tax=Nocardioides currus TaxID=2133958 RepID=A0A2R7Z3G3_9ACTN|nr:peptidylprolyl isomerase [Nocardioides currus]
MKRNRTVLGLSLAAATIALGACGGGDDGADNAGAAKEPTSQSSESDAAGDETDETDQAAEPDLSDIPDVVAEVNGEEVTKDEFVVVYEAQFQQAAMQAQMGGEQPDEETLKKQTADNLVNTELMAQEAEARGIEITDTDVDDELTSLAKQNQMKSSDEILAALEQQGTSEDEARQQVESQLMIEQLVDDEAGSTEPSEKDLRTLYAQAKQQQAQQGEQAQKIPPFAKVRSQLEEQAKSDKVNEVAQGMVEDLRKDADITINL